jgi:putative transposase
MCDGFLNEMLCFDLDDARTKIAAWALDFNVKRRMLRYLPPAAYAAL